MRISDWSSDVCSSDLFSNSGVVACGAASLLSGIAQNFDAALDGNQRSGEPDEQVGPVRAEPPDEDAGEQDAAVRNEVVEAEGRCRTKVDVGIMNALKQLQVGIVHPRRNRQHDHHRSADWFRPLKIWPHNSE